MSDQEKHIPQIEIAVTKLPSRGVPYPPGSWVKYRNYTWGEVRKASVSNVGVNETLKRSLNGVECSFDKTQLTVADALYLGILRKVSTFSGMQVEVPYVCGGCGKTNKGRFTEKDIKFRDLPAEVTELPIVVEFGDKELEFSPMTVRQYYDLNEGRYQKTIGNGKPDEMAVQAAWIKNMDYDESYKFITGLTSLEDMEIMTEIDKLMLHDMAKMEFTCDNPKCGQVNLVKLEGREALLRPFRDGKKSDRSRIHIGKRAKPASAKSDDDGVQPGTSTKA